eukprot:EG_transcript_4046
MQQDEALVASTCSQRLTEGLLLDQLASLQVDLNAAQRRNALLEQQITDRTFELIHTQNQWRRDRQSAHSLAQQVDQLRGKILALESRVDPPPAALPPTTDVSLPGSFSFSISAREREAGQKATTPMLKAERTHWQRQLWEARGKVKHLKLITKERFRRTELQLMEHADLLSHAFSVHLEEPEPWQVSDRRAREEHTIAVAGGHTSSGRRGSSRGVDPPSADLQRTSLQIDPVAMATPEDVMIEFLCSHTRGGYYYRQVWTQGKEGLGAVKESADAVVKEVWGQALRLAVTPPALMEKAVQRLQAHVRAWVTHAKVTMLQCVRQLNADILEMLKTERVWFDTREMWDATTQCDLQAPAPAQTLQVPQQQSPRSQRTSRKGKATRFCTTRLDSAAYAACFRLHVTAVRLLARLRDCCAPFVALMEARGCQVPGDPLGPAEDKLAQAAHFQQNAQQIVREDCQGLRLLMEYLLPRCAALGRVDSRSATRPTSDPSQEGPAVSEPPSSHSSETDSSQLDRLTSEDFQAMFEAVDTATRDDAERTTHLALSTTFSTGSLSAHRRGPDTSRHSASSGSPKSPGMARLGSFASRRASHHQPPGEPQPRRFSQWQQPTPAQLRERVASNARLSARRGTVTRPRLKTELSFQLEDHSPARRRSTMQAAKQPGFPRAARKESHRTREPDPEHAPASASGCVRFAEPSPPHSPSLAATDAVPTAKLSLAALLPHHPAFALADTFRATADGATQTAVAAQSAAAQTSPR